MDSSSGTGTGKKPCPACLIAEALDPLDDSQTSPEAIPASPSKSDALEGTTLGADDRIHSDSTVEGSRYGLDTSFLSN